MAYKDRENLKTPQGTGNPLFQQMTSTNFAHQFYSVSNDFNEAFDLIFKNDYRGVFNFEPGIFHF